MMIKVPRYLRVYLLVGLTALNQTSYSAQAITLPAQIDCSEKIILKKDELPSYLDEIWDSFCSYIFLNNKAPDGMVTVFGGNHLPKEDIDNYQLIQTFAKKWTEHPQAKQWPIASGGGRGVMSAATKGAQSALDGHGKALNLVVNIHGQSTQYDERENTFVYRGMSKREQDLINYAQAAVFGLGKVGTEWEFFEVIEKIHLSKKRIIPVIILAPSEKAEAFIKGLFSLKKIGLIHEEEVAYVNITNSPDKAVQLILMSTDKRKKDRTCAANLSFLAD
ncbi:MAG: LOG family protein [Legionellaceae bacterium]|nr:LOG family protein [Legionellaceae bacterium]